MLTMSQVADQMSLREYVALCRYFDLLKQQEAKPTMIASGYALNAKFQTVAPRMNFARFDISEIERSQDSFIVTAEDEHGKMHRIDANEARTD